MSKPFAWQPRQFRTIEQYAAWLATQTRPAWIKGLTLHHTVSPLPQKWLGQQTMTNLGLYYRDQVKNNDGTKGWSAGPHAFICVGSPNPANDGIWLGTPFESRGVHAVSFNATHLGFEVVGNFDKTPWPTNLAALVEGMTALTLNWLKLPTSTVNGHRDDPTTDKTCPGRALNLDLVRANIERRRKPTTRRRVIQGIDYANIRTSPSIPRAGSPSNIVGRLFPGEIILVDDVNNGFEHISPNDPRRDLGFVHSSLLENAPA